MIISRGPAANPRSGFDQDFPFKPDLHDKRVCRLHHIVGEEFCQGDAPHLAYAYLRWVDCVIHRERRYGVVEVWVATGRLPRHREDTIGATGCRAKLAGLFHRRLAMIAAKPHPRRDTVIARGSKPPIWPHLPCANLAEVLNQLAKDPSFSHEVDRSFAPRTVVPMPQRGIAHSFGGEHHWDQTLLKVAVRPEVPHELGGVLLVVIIELVDQAIEWRLAKPVARIQLEVGYVGPLRVGIHSSETIRT